jgi:tellurite resistance protein TerC
MTLWWIFFGVFIAAMLALDLGVFKRRAHVISVKEALLWTAFWVTLALMSCTGIYLFFGHQKGIEFLAGYLIEYSLSIDNLFVFLLLFRYFNLPHDYEHKTLFWGILLAFITRGIFIFTGVALINTFHWIMYIFGAFLIFTGIKMAFNEGTEVHHDKNVAIRLLRLFIPMTKEFTEARFFIVRQGKCLATPMLTVMLALETTDIVFAIDSIPAILAITTDPFIVYTSNMFAILGLRSLFFAIAGLMKLFHHLHYGLAAVLSFVGIKILIADFFKIPTGFSLGIIALILTCAVGCSLIWPCKDVVSKNDEVGA